MNKKLECAYSISGVNKQNTDGEHTAGDFNGQKQDKHTSGNKRKGSPGFINGSSFEKPDPFQMVSPGIPEGHDYKGVKIRTLKRKVLVRRITTLLMVIILLTLPLVLLAVDFNNKNIVITIDGEFDDWDGFQAYHDSDSDQMDNPSSNLNEIRIAESRTDVFLYAEVYELMFDRVSARFDGEDPTLVFTLYFLIDEDINERTGYFINGIGADLLIKINGRNGIIVLSSLLIFTQEASNDDWNGWYQIANVHSSSGGNALELQVPKTAFESEAFIMSAILKDGAGNQDIFDYNIGYGTACVNGELISIIDEHIDLDEPGQGEKELLRYKILAIGEKTELEKVNLKINSEFDPDSIGLFSLKINTDSADSTSIRDSIGMILNSRYHSSASGHTNNYVLTCEFDAPLSIHEAEEMEIGFFLEGKNHNYGSFHFDIVLDNDMLGLSNGGMFLLRTPGDLHLPIAVGPPGTGIVIDGSFLDWYDKDRVQDLDMSSVSNGDIDIDTYKLHEDNEYISFYISVKGMILWGTSVPEQPEHIDSGSRIVIDGSGISSNAQVCDNKENFKPPDVLLGDDKAYIFIDSDADIETGYQNVGMDIGADYCMEITGKNGMIYQHNLLEYGSEDGSSWDWERVTEVDAAIDFKRLETQVELASLNLEVGNLYHYFIYMTDWNLESDSADGSKPVSRALPKTLPEPLLPNLDEQPKNNSRISMKGEPGLTADQNGVSTRGQKIGNSTTYLATAESNQYKLVRDSRGIWYAFWQSTNSIFAANSTSSTGESWNSEIVLIGSGGKVVDTTKIANFTSVAVERDETGNKDKIHLVCMFNVDDVLYTKLVNIDDFDNSSGSAWKVANESRAGFELIDSAIGYDIHYPSLAINSTGTPHVVWTQNSSVSKLYYTHATSDRWIKPVKITNDSKSFGFSVASIDVDNNDNLHLSWYNYSSKNIEYKRCLRGNDYSVNSSWKSANQTAGRDIIIFGPNRMYFPSMVTDINNNVWVITHDWVDFDIWLNKCTDKNWSSPKKLASQDALKYPTIGTDNNGNVHAVWLNTTTNEMMYMYHTDKWSGNFTLISSGGGIKNYPSLERHMWSGANLSGIIYTNSSKKDISFLFVDDHLDIPEFDMALQFMAICVSIVILNLIFVRRRREIRYEYDRI